MAGLKPKPWLEGIVVFYLGLSCGLAEAALVLAASPTLGPYAPFQLPGDLAFGFPFVAAFFHGLVAPGWRMALAAALIFALTTGTGIAAVILTPAVLDYTPERGAALNLAIRQAFAAFFVTLLTGGPGLLVGTGLRHLAGRPD